MQVGRKYSRLEGRTGRKELFRVGFAFVAWAPEGFGHCEVDFEGLAIDVSGRGVKTADSQHVSINHTLCERQQRVRVRRKDWVLSRY
jgi:hypothetical protein